MSSTPQDNREPQKWAILIGINYYMPGEARYPIHAGHLGGCLNDVTLVENYLVDHQQVDRGHIRKLTASRPSTGDTGLPTEASELWPTYENIMAALERVTSDAAEDDIVYIHYSGHGSRASTIVPSAKPGGVGRSGIDETLVPTDFNKGGRYLRDVELAYMLQKMVNKHLHVTVVLDSCHSGGMGRNHTDEPNESTIRTLQGLGPDGVDHFRLRTDVSEIPEADLEEVAKISPWSRPRNSESQLLPRGWVMVAACQPSEKAWERLLTIGQSGPKYYGQLTYGWVDSLLRAPGPIAYQALFRRTQETMNLLQQIPVIMGNVQRQMFLKTTTHVTHTIPVSHSESRRLLVRGGRAHGVCEGDIFGIYPWDKDHIDISSSHPLATAEVKVVRPTEADAYLQLEAGKSVPQGSHAVLIRRTIPRVTLCLILKPRPDTNEAGNVKLDQLRSCDLSNQNFNARIMVSDAVTVTTGSNTTTFQYRVTVKGDQYLLSELADTSHNTFPPSDTLESFLKLLGHLGLYNHYRSLQGPGLVPLDFLFRPELGDFHYVPERNLIQVVDGRSLDISFENRTRDFLYISVFYFSSCWGVHRVYPPSNIGDYEQVDWSHRRTLTIRPRFPSAAAGRPYVTEILKVFVTTKPTSFRTLENIEDLDPFSEVGRQAVTPGSNSHQELLEALEAFDSPQELGREIESRGVFIDDDEIDRGSRPLDLEGVSGGTEEAWQTKDIIVNIYAPGTTLAQQ